MTMPKLKRVRLRAALSDSKSFLLIACLLSGCASQPSSDVNELDLSTLAIGSEISRESNDIDPVSMPASRDQAESDQVASRENIQIPPIAANPSDVGSNGSESRIVLPQPTTSTVDAAVPALPLPQFIDAVFGKMVGVPYTTGPGVAERNDVIQLRSSGKMRSEDFLELVSNSLENYQVRVVPVQGAYEIVSDSTLQARVPRFIRSRSRVDVPADMRPLVQFVELEAIAANEMQAILQQTFPRGDGLEVESNPRLNVVTLTGFADDIDAALSIIDQLDELAYAGTDAERYSPVFWSASALASELVKLLAAEGWQASASEAIQRSILVIPVEYSNDIFVFSRSAQGLQRARFWLSELDRASRKGDGPQIFLYAVQNVDAELLAETANAVLARQNQTAFSDPLAGAGAPPINNGPNAGDGRSDQGSSNGGFVVDPQSNQIIFSGTPSQYDQILPLLRQLDAPPAEVLIEVVVAEVTLNDDTRYGVEFFIDSLGNSEFTGTIGNQGLGLGGAGTNIAVLTGNVDAAINFFANNNLLKVLSTPHLVARSGGAAQIQVGSDVPIITSQRASDTQDGTGDTDILQSVDYRSTGVLLAIEPIVFGDNRIDLSISQEVSTAISTTTSAIASPTISNRTVTTQLSLEDGATAVLGGLIQETTTRDETGAPLLKDLPIVGSAFRNTNITQTRTELLVLITAYVMRGTEDKRAFTSEFIERFNKTTFDNQDLSTYRGENLHSAPKIDLNSPDE